MLKPTAKHVRRTSWVVGGLEAGAVLFILGLVLLYLNPFWHFDEGGFLDWRLRWWNNVGQLLIAAGWLTEAVAMVASLAVIVSHLAGRRSWPYFVAGLLVVCIVVWVAPSGFIHDLDAHFEWNSSDGFTAFHLQSWDEAAGAWHSAGGTLLNSIVAVEIQPVLRGFFRINDWQKMNGDLSIKLARILPVAWPVALGSGGEILEDPDETDLMRTAAHGDLKGLQHLLAITPHSNVNALDQGGQTALILACQNPKADAEVVKALIAAGADVNLRSRSGYTALTWARARSNNQVTNLLRRAGGRP
jgi:predicted anti-sigma-YlaC factor YlaD